MIIRFLSTILPIKSNEWEGVFYFFLVLLLFSIGASFARNIGMTLLVENLGGDKLPIVFIAIDLSVMVGSMVYAHYTKKISGLAILGFFFIASAVFSVVAQSLFILNEQWLQNANWVYGFFFIGFFFFYILIFIHVSSVVASYFTAVQIKRVTNVINTGIPIGGILGGTTLVMLLNVFNFKPSSLVLGFGLACLGALWLLRLINVRLSPVRAGTAEFRSNKAPIQELIAAFKYIMSSQLMICMSLGLMVFVIGNKLLEYEYQAIIYPEIYPKSTDRATFFATYEVFANLTWLVIQLFLTSRVVMRLGVGASNLVYPILSGIVSTALFLYFYWKSQGYIEGSLVIMLALGVFTQFINQEMRGALRTPINNLLFNAVPPNLWGTNKAFLNGIIFPLSTVIAGTFLILMTGKETNPLLSFTFPQEQLSYLLPLIVMVGSVLGIIIALPQWAAYNKGMFGLLNRELFDRNTDLNLGKHSNLRGIIEEKLGSLDPYHVIGALEIIRLLKLDYFATRVGSLLLRTKSYEVKLYCLNALAALPTSNTIVTYLLEALKVEEDHQTLATILRNLVYYPSASYNKTVEKLLAHPAPEVFVEACLCLYHHPHYPRKPDIERKILARLMSNPDSSQFSLYLYALGELRQLQYHEIVIPFIEHHKPEISLAAFKAHLNMLGEQINEHTAYLTAALNSPIKGIRITALNALKSCKPLDNWEPVIELLDDKDKLVVHESKELLQLHLNDCRSKIIVKLLSNELSVQQQFEILSLVYAKLNDQQRQGLLQIATETLKKFIYVNALLKVHQTAEKITKVHELITKVLQEIAEDQLFHVLVIITFASDKNLEFFQRVSRGLMSASRANQGNALEVLSNAGEKYLAGRVLKYFDERFNDLKNFQRLYQTLFKEPLTIEEKRYTEHLLALNHDVLNACLYYVKFEETGALNLEYCSPKVCELLAGIVDEDE